MQSVTVGLGEIAISDDPDTVLVAFGLGSCLGVVVYDPALRRGGMLHAVLPQRTANGNGPESQIGKYVDAGLLHLLNQFKSARAGGRLSIKLAGAANMFAAHGLDPSFQIGDRNYETASAMLSNDGLTVAAAQVGGTVGRTVRLYIGDGRTTVRSLGQPEVDF